MDSDRQLRASLDLGDSVRREGVLGVLPDVDVAAELRPSTLVDDVRRDLGITDKGGILLTGADAGTVPRKLGVNWGQCQYDADPGEKGSEIGVDVIPWNPTLAGEPASPWAFRICAWPWTRDTKAVIRSTLAEIAMLMGRGGSFGEESEKVLLGQGKQKRK